MAVLQNYHDIAFLDALARVGTELIGQLKIRSYYVALRNPVLYQMLDLILVSLKQIKSPVEVLLALQLLT